MTMEMAMRYPQAPPAWRRERLRARTRHCAGLLSPVAMQQEILFTYGTFDPIIPAEKVKVR